MYLACVELISPPVRQDGAAAADAVVSREFAELPAARAWAADTAASRADATGNAAVFRTLGPFAHLEWEADAPALRLVNGDATEAAPDDSPRLLRA